MINIHMIVIKLTNMVTTLSQLIRL